RPPRGLPFAPGGLRRPRRTGRQSPARPVGTDVVASQQRRQFSTRLRSSAHLTDENYNLRLYGYLANPPAPRIAHRHPDLPRLSVSHDPDNTGVPFATPRRRQHLEGEAETHLDRSLPDVPVPADRLLLHRLPGGRLVPGRDGVPDLGRPGHPPGGDD